MGAATAGALVYRRAERSAAHAGMVAPRVMRIALTIRTFFMVASRRWPQLDYANAYRLGSSLDWFMMDIDLNLLRIFDILYDERNVTRAAARLFLTQSAVSHALARLREVLGDPLFMRIPSGLQPTERAHQPAPASATTARG